MKRQKWLIAGLLLIKAMNFSCVKVDGISNSKRPLSLLQEVKRDRTPWVFRLNLDERPRALVLALNRDLWATYDTESSGLHRAWTGGVNFNGIVFNNMHGVQPNSIGLPYIEDELKESPWLVSIEGKARRVEAEYDGYFLNDNSRKIH